ncbi:MAG: hypothetical protein OXC53_08180 [Rhodobacteraceae bacterium]|nr:hypothetical protein [Gammaproteobacteria bacterium]MCY4327548.1 hypothetical protein [Paracoccaceae bacterium]
MTGEALERILITVKTYPTLSAKYGETVCTAGLREDGSWVRIYPVPFRGLESEEQYKKYDWVECKLVRRSNDHRPESYSPDYREGFTQVDHLGTSGRWRARRHLLLKDGMVFRVIGSLIEDAKSNVRSLAIFKPTKIIEFTWEVDEPEWDARKLAAMRARHNQLDLFDEVSWRDRIFKVIPKLPYNFYYRFTDADGRESRLIILDWEIGALYWNCRRSSANDSEALEKVKRKYWDDFMKSDLHFYLGTTQLFHQMAPNPWVIIGVLPIPFDRQSVIDL